MTRRPSKDIAIHVQEKKYFKQYDAPISDDKCLHTLTSFIRALHIDINPTPSHTSHEKMTMTEIYNRECLQIMRVFDILVLIMSL